MSLLVDILLVFLKPPLFFFLFLVCYCSGLAYLSAFSNFISMTLIGSFPCALYLQDPTPLPYLQHSDPYSFDINLQVAIKGKSYECLLFKHAGTKLCVYNHCQKIMYFKSTRSSFPYMLDSDLWSWCTLSLCDVCFGNGTWLTVCFTLLIANNWKLSALSEYFTWRKLAAALCEHFSPFWFEFCLWWIFAGGRNAEV